MNSIAKAGFRYLIETLNSNGDVIDTEVVDNLMPVEGENHMLGVTLKGIAQVPSWYVGIYEGNYAPVAGDTAALFPTAATETTAYAEITRVVLALGAITAGAVDNGAAPSIFTLNAPKTIYGGFISSASAKGAATGVLLSAVRFGSPKVLAPAEMLRVTAGFTLVSA